MTEENLYCVTETHELSRLKTEQKLKRRHGRRGEQEKFLSRTSFSYDSRASSAPVRARPGSSTSFMQPGGTPTDALKGVRIYVDGMGPGCVTECLLVTKRDRLLETFACFLSGKRAPTHKVLFDDGCEDTVNLNRTTYWVLDDIESNDQIRRQDRNMLSGLDSSSEIEPRLLLQPVIDLVQETLKACDMSSNREEARKAKPRLASVHAGLEHTMDVLLDYPAALHLARPFLKQMTQSLQPVARLLACPENGRAKQLGPDDIESLESGLDELEKALQQNRRALEASAARTNLQDYEIRADDVVFGDPLGQGGFAKVYACDWQGARMAAKCFDMRNLSVKQHMSLVRSFQTEIEVAFKLRSPRVLHVFGICSSVPERLYIIMELAEGGSVRAKLDAASSPLSDAELWGLARDTALGMRYLHGHGIIHRDLKSHNVLLDGQGGAKVADFGIADATGKLMTTAGSNHNGLVGTVAWMAPEAIHSEAVMRSDVYSFGVFLWELATRELPWQGKGMPGIIYSVCFESARLPTQDIGDEELRNMLARCWEHLPENRPSFEQLERELLSRCRKLGLASTAMPAAAPKTSGSQSAPTPVPPLALRKKEQVPVPVTVVTMADRISAESKTTLSTPTLADRIGTEISTQFLESPLTSARNGVSSHAAEPPAAARGEWTKANLDSALTRLQKGPARTIRAPPVSEASHTVCPPSRPVAGNLTATAGGLFSPAPRRHQAVRIVPPANGHGGSSMLEARLPGNNGYQPQSIFPPSASTGSRPPRKSAEFGTPAESVPLAKKAAQATTLSPQIGKVSSSVITGVREHDKVADKNVAMRFGAGGAQANPPKQDPRVQWSRGVLSNRPVHAPSSSTLARTGPLT